MTGERVSAPLSNPIKRWLQRGKAGSPARSEDAAPAATSSQPEIEGASPAPGPAAVPPVDLVGLGKHLGRLGREQFRLNALLEDQQQQLQSALQRLQGAQQSLQEEDVRRTEERAVLLAHGEAERVEARIQVVARLFPVLDGLDEALASGRRLLAGVPIAPASRVLPADPASSSVRITLAAWSSALLERLLIGSLRPSAARPRPNADPALAAWLDAGRAWLQGLELVRGRLVDILAAEGVQPIAAEATRFDPHWHVALGTAPARAEVPAGTIVAELRRGYRLGERVLRYAEVTVASAEGKEQ